MIGHCDDREQSRVRALMGYAEEVSPMEEVRSHGNVLVDLPPPVMTQSPVEASTVVRRSRMRFSVAGVAALVMGVVLTQW
jgi:hypothetical protein